MLKTLMHTGLALTLLAGATIATTSQAEARRGARTAGIVAGAVIGLGVLGAYAAARERNYERSYQRTCYEGRQRCDIVGQRCWYSRYGEYVCKDDVRCYRPTVCN